MADGTEATRKTLSPAGTSEPPVQGHLHLSTQIVAVIPELPPHQWSPLPISPRKHRRRHTGIASSPSLSISGFAVTDVYTQASPLPHRNRVIAIAVHLRPAARAASQNIKPVAKPGLWILNLHRATFLPMCNEKELAGPFGGKE